jgi:hypothetical protein
MPQDDRALLARLNQHQTDYVIVGGVACVLHGASYVTYDLDICIRLAADNFYRIQAAVKDLHPYHRLSGQKLPLELTDELCTRLKNMYLQTDLGTLDCLGEILGIGDFDKVAGFSITMSFPFGACRVLSLDALIASKEAAGRDKDPRALRFLRAIKDRPKLGGSAVSQQT